MKLYEVVFTFTPADDSSGEGVVTISARDEEEAREAVLEFLGEAPDLNISSIKEIVELPDQLDFTPRTLQ